ncbi:MAG: hypothetical protein RLZZ182_122 [Pseudomonadota bacterium]
MVVIECEDMDTPTEKAQWWGYRSTHFELEPFACAALSVIHLISCTVVNMSSSVPPVSRDTLPVGFQLHEYVVEGVLGVGGFGVVYRAHDPQLQRQVAIKEYLPAALAARGEGGQVVLRAEQHRAAFDLGLQSFVNEARLLARFDHPALVRVFRFWEAQGTAYMVMPCYEGATLYAARKAMEGPPPEAWLRALMEPLLGALDLLHREQVFHRDVAPDNILIVPDADAPQGMRPVLLDFGAARRVITDHTQSLTAILKPSFAPIEQYAETSHLRQGAWTDLYALAAVLHYCLTGRTPVPSTARAVHDDLAPLSGMADELGRDFQLQYATALLETIDRGLAVRPEQRLASVAQWRASLRNEPLPPITQAITRTTMAPVRAEVPGVSGAEPHRPPTFAPTLLVSRPDAVPGAGSEPQAVSVAATEGKAQQGAGRMRWQRAAWVAAGGVLLAGLTWQLWPGKHQATDEMPALASASAPAAAAAPSGPAPKAGRVASAVPAAASSSTERSAERHQAPRAQSPGVSRPGSDLPSEASAKQASASAGRDNRPSADGDSARNPDEVCGGRVFIAKALCMKRQCERPRFRQHAQCVKFKQQEADQRKALEGV